MINEKNFNFTHEEIKEFINEDLNFDYLITSYMVHKIIMYAIRNKLMDSYDIKDYMMYSTIYKKELFKNPKIKKLFDSNQDIITWDKGIIALEENKD